MAKGGAQIDGKGRFLIENLSKKGEKKKRKKKNNKRAQGKGAPNEGGSQNQKPLGGGAKRTKQTPKVQTTLKFLNNDYQSEKRN